MIWGKRRFQWATMPDTETCSVSCSSSTQRAIASVMFAIEHKVGEQDIYVGVPSKELMALFDGFEPVSGAALPKLVDGLLLADVNAFEEAGFEFRHNRH